MIEFVKGKDIHVELSQHLRQQAIKGFFISVKHFGIDYYIPVSYGLKTLLRIRIKGGKPEFPDYNAECAASDILSNIIASLYLQVRDTVGHEIEQNIHQELKDSFSKMFANVISAKVTKEFETVALKSPDKNRG